MTHRLRAATSLVMVKYFFLDKIIYKLITLFSVKTVAPFTYSGASGAIIHPGEKIAVTGGDPHYMWSGLASRDTSGEIEVHEISLPRTLLEWPEIPFTHLAILRHGGHEDTARISLQLEGHDAEGASNEGQARAERETSKAPWALWERVVKRK